MPYVPEEVREELVVLGLCAKSAGELNYRFTKVLIEYVEHNALSYRTINDILGALDGASREFYRRIAVPYEEAARKRNGDVYKDLLPLLP